MQNNKRQSIKENVESDFVEKSKDGFINLKQLDMKLLQNIVKFSVDNYELCWDFISKMFDNIGLDLTFLKCPKLILFPANIFNIKEFNLYKKYQAIFDMLFDYGASIFKDDFSKYIDFWFYILNNYGQDVDKYNRVLENLKGIDKMNIDEIILVLSSKSIETIDLTYQPFGSIRNEILVRQYYLEENFYSDAEFEDQLDGCYVKINLYNPSYIIKGNRTVGYCLNYGNFDIKKWEMKIYDLSFKGDIFNINALDTVCTLESYKKLIYNEKMKLLQKYLSEISNSIESIKDKTEKLKLIMEELEIDEKLDDVFSKEESSIIKFTKKSDFQKVFNRKY